MAAFSYGNALDGNILTVLQGYSLVGLTYASALNNPGFLGISLRQSTAVDDSPTGDGHIHLSVGPYQLVMKERVTTVLILRSVENLTFVIRRPVGRSHDARTSLEPQFDIIVEMNAPTKIRSGGQYHRATTLLLSLGDCNVYIFGIQALAVALSSVVAHVVGGGSAENSCQQTDKYKRYFLHVGFR